MKEVYGEHIFGYLQPKRTLDSIAAQLRDEYDITIKTGKTVFCKGKTKNGFGITCPLPIDEQVEQMQIEENL